MIHLRIFLGGVSDEHFETEVLRSSEPLGDEGSDRNQLSCYQTEDDPVESHDSPWYELYPFCLDASDEDKVRSISHALANYEFLFPKSEDRAHNLPPDFILFI